jgi:glycosyltransferase involved in cell wall biosynthesis
MVERDHDALTTEVGSDDMPDVSVVVPFYNPGARLEATIKGLLQDLDAVSRRFEVIAVSDGSTDHSEKTIEGMDERLKVVLLGQNFGKGEALRVGMTMSRGRYIGFIDADGDIPTKFMAEFYEVARATDVEIIVGSKNHPGSRIESGWLRRALSLTWQSMTRVMFQLPVSDSQVGIKLFRRDVIDQSLPRTMMRGFAFDIEILVVSHDLGFRQLIERPIEIRERLASTISIGSAAHMVGDLLVLFWRLRMVPWFAHQRRPAAQT